MGAVSLCEKVALLFGVRAFFFVGPPVFPLGAALLPSPSLVRGAGPSSLLPRLGLLEFAVVSSSLFPSFSLSFAPVAAPAVAPVVTVVNAVPAWVATVDRASVSEALCLAGASASAAGDMVVLTLASGRVLQCRPSVVTRAGLGRPSGASIAAKLNARAAAGETVRFVSALGYKLARGGWFVGAFPV